MHMSMDKVTEEGMARQYASLHQELVRELSERDAAYVQDRFRRDEAALGEFYGKTIDQEMALLGSSRSDLERKLAETKTGLRAVQERITKGEHSGGIGKLLWTYLRAPWQRRTEARLDACASSTADSLQQIIDKYDRLRTDPTEKLRVMRAGLHDLLRTDREEKLKRGAMFGDRFGIHRMYWSDGFSEVADGAWSEYVEERIYLGDGFGAVQSIHRSTRDYPQRILYIVDIDRGEVIKDRSIGRSYVLGHTRDKDKITIRLYAGDWFRELVHIDRKTGDIWTRTKHISQCSG